MGALSYVDDITIICPSTYGLNFMLNICNQFVCNNCINVNTKQTVCIKFSEYVEVRHLRIILNYKSDN